MIKYVLMGVSAAALLLVGMNADAITSQNYKKALSFGNVVKGGKGTLVNRKSNKGSITPKAEQTSGKVTTIYMLGNGNDTRKLASLSDGEVVKIHLPRETKDGSWINNWIRTWSLTYYETDGDSYTSTSSYARENDLNQGFVGSCGEVSSSYESASGNKIMTLKYKAPSRVYSDSCGLTLQCWGTGCPGGNPVQICSDALNSISGSSASGDGSGGVSTDSDFACPGYNNCTCGKRRPADCENDSYLPSCKLHIGNMKQVGSKKTAINKTLQIGNGGECPSGYTWNSSTNLCSAPVASCDLNLFKYRCEGTQEVAPSGHGDSCDTGTYTFYTECDCRDIDYHWDAGAEHCTNSGSGLDDGNSGNSGN